MHTAISHRFSNSRRHQSPKGNKSNLTKLTRSPCLVQNQTSSTKESPNVTHPPPPPPPPKKKNKKMLNFLTLAHSIDCVVHSIDSRISFSSHFAPNCPFIMIY